MEVFNNRKQGGQPCNQNARRHGYYSKTLDAAGKRDYEQAKTVGGLEEEIALLRAKMMGVLRYDPNNTRLLTDAMGTLARLLITRRQIAKDAMIELDLKKIEAPDFTASIRPGMPALVVLNEDAVPKTYWEPGEPRLRRQVLAHDLKGGAEITGATLSNPEPVLSVRTR